MFDIVPFLGGFTTNVVITSVGTSIVPIVQAKPNRPILYITNPSTTQPLSAFIDPVPLAGSPHFVIPPSTTMGWTWTLDGPMSTFAWLAVYASGTSNVIATEVIWFPQNIDTKG